MAGGQGHSPGHGLGEARLDLCRDLGRLGHHDVNFQGRAFLQFPEEIHRGKLMEGEVRHLLGRKVRGGDFKNLSGGASWVRHRVQDRKSVVRERV